MFKVSLEFGPGWDTFGADLVNDPMWQRGATAGAEEVGEQTRADVATKGWADLPAFEIEAAGREGNATVAVAKTSSTPFVWVDEGVPNYGFGGPGSGYSMNFKGAYSPKTDGGSGAQSGRQYMGIEQIHSRGIRARNILDRVIDQKYDEIVAAIFAAIG